MEQLLGELEDCIPTANNIDRHIEAQALSQCLHAWLGVLSPKDRILFVRRYWYAESVQSLAAERGESPNRVSQRLLRLRKGLQKHLEQEGIAV